MIGAGNNKGVIGKDEEDIENIMGPTPLSDLGRQRLRTIANEIDKMGEAASAEYRQRGTKMLLVPEGTSS